MWYWLIMGFFTLLFAAGANGQAVDEYQVKAAFLYNFAKFVDWPPQTFKAPNDPVTVCVLGHSPVAKVLEEVIRGKAVEGRTFAFLQVSEAEAAKACQILFVGASETKHFRSLCGSLRTAGILTIGESPGFALDGGVINFKLDGGHVRFEINVEAAEREQLRISSKLLSLAQIVKGDKNQ